MTEKPDNLNCDMCGEPDLQLIKVGNDTDSNVLYVCEDCLYYASYRGAKHN
jgi:ribosome-binding protein aMBF1 (putative translation factor)